MDIADFLTPDRIALVPRVRDKGQLLADLAARVAPDCDGIPAGTILAALLTREGLGSTGLGKGFALPHARIEGLKRFIGLFARLARPISYDAIDGAPVDLVFLLLMPAEASGQHMSALAAVSRRFRDAGVTTALRTADLAKVTRILLPGTP